MVDTTMLSSTKPTGSNMASSAYKTISLINNSSSSKLKVQNRMATMEDDDLINIGDVKIPKSNSKHRFSKVRELIKKQKQQTTKKVLNTETSQMSEDPIHKNVVSDLHASYFYFLRRRLMKKLLKKSQDGSRSRSRTKSSRKRSPVLEKLDHSVSINQSMINQKAKLDNHSLLLISNPISSSLIRESDLRNLLLTQAN